MITYVQAHRQNETSRLRWRIEPILDQFQVAPSTYYEAKTRPPPREVSPHSFYVSVSGSAAGVVLETTGRAFSTEKLPALRSFGGGPEAPDSS